MTVPSIYELLGERITKHDGFSADLSQLIRAYCSRDESALELQTARRLVESAAIMACSSAEMHRQVALKIVSQMVTIAEKANPVLDASSELLLVRLGNFPTLELMVHERKKPDFYGVLNGGKPEVSTLSVYAEVLQRLAKNELQLPEGRLHFTDFQATVLSHLREGASLSVSAPTSAGKSFIVGRYILEQLKRESEFTAVYVVPTKALIGERKRDFNVLLVEAGLQSVPVFSTSFEVVRGYERKPKKAVWIVTQERLQAIQSRIHDPVKLDLIVVDEAQRIEEGARGIILEQTVNRAIRSNPHVQVVFLSPFTENPEKLTQVFNHPALLLTTKYSPVDQNVFLVKTDSKGYEICYVSKELGREISVSRVDSSGTSPPKANYKKKAWAVRTLISEGPTIVYCNNADQCVKTSEALADTRDSGEPSQIVTEVVRFLSRNVHKDYYLNDFLGKKIAYHYGNMPSLVRVAVESLFRGKMIDVICCTNTLLEGINMPAKNMVLYRPKIGSVPMNEISFLNLTGRAGRFAKDFCGDIFCIDVDEWKEDGYIPSPQEVSHRIGSSMEQVVHDKREDVIEHLRTYTKVRFDNEDLETVRAAVTRFLISELRKENKELFAQLKIRESRITDAYLKEIEVFVEDIVGQIRELPGKVILKNENIDPRLQYDLFKKLMSLPNPPIPIHHPNDTRCYDDLLQILQLTNHSFGRGLSERQVIRITVLAMKWIREEGLREIIDGQIRHDAGSIDGKVSKSAVNGIIRDTMKTISEDIEFKSYRDVSCYMDIMGYVMEKRGIHENYIFPLQYYLELGASNPSTVTIVNMGVPRTIAILISQMIGKEISDPDELVKAIDKILPRMRTEIPSIILDYVFTSYLQKEGVDQN